MKKRKTIYDLFSIAPEQHKARLELKEAKRLASVDPNAPKYVWIPADTYNCRCSLTFIESTYENNVSKKYRKLNT